MRGVWLLLVLSLAATAFLVPRGRAQAGGAPGPPQGLVARGGGLLDRHPTACISPAERARAARNIARYYARHGRPRSRGRLTGPTPYPFHPQAGTLWDDLFINNFTDLDPTSPGTRDWDCTSVTYDGHTGHDVHLGYSFWEQDTGVPIFAALDGTVVDAHDGEPDHNTTAPDVPANYVILDHGDTHRSLYWHLRRGSVAVSVGQSVRAGTQLGLQGSSGRSTGSHLHFESHYNGTWYEPYAGGCHAGTSNWVRQVPIRRTPYARDLGLTDANPADYADPLLEMPREGTFPTGGQRVTVFTVLNFLPASSTWQLKFTRPDGSLRLDSGVQAFNNPVTYRGNWFYLIFFVDLDVTGIWHAEVLINGQSLFQAPFEVVTPGTPAVNHPPNATGAPAFDPPRPAPGEAVFCRLPEPPPARDPDYDRVRYQYVWRVNGSVVRTVTSAARADAIPHSLVTYGDILSCTVTPSDGTVNGPTATAQVPIGSSASGTVTANGAPLPGVAISAGNRSVTTAGDGTYTLGGLAPGTHTVTPALAGYVFTPASRSVTVGPDQTGVNFTAAARFDISGRIAQGATAAAGVTVSAGGASATTGLDGRYTLRELAAGTYTVTPAKAGFVFSPATRSVALTTASAPGVDFTALPLLNIRGTVTQNGAGISGVTLTAGGKSTTSGTNGAYALSGLTPGTYAVVPTRAGSAFTPSSRSVTLSTADAGGIDFAAVVTRRISGSVTLNGRGLSGVSVAAGTRAATTDAAGIYTITGAVPGTYRVVPSRPGYRFTPASLSVTVGSADVTGVNFAAQGALSISGVVTFGASALAGVTVAAGGTSTTTSAAGTYTLAGLVPGAHTVIPRRAFYVFSPASRVVSLTTTHATGQNFAATGTLSIRGTVTFRSLGLAGVSVAAGGKTATTASNGAYTLAGLGPGSYTVRPARAGYAFTPISRAATLSTASVTGINFTAGGALTLSGTITYQNRALAGVAVTAAGRTLTTSTAGTYSFTGLTPGAYTVRPAKTGYAFTPASRSFSLTTTSAAGVNFTAAGALSISGTVTVGGAGLFGVTISAGGKTALTQPTGAYSLTGLAPGAYTVIPSRAGYAFTPAGRAVTLATVSVARQNFTAARTLSINGRVTVGGVGRVGVTVTAGLAALAGEGRPAEASLGGRWPRGLAVGRPPPCSLRRSRWCPSGPDG